MSVSVSVSGARRALATGAAPMPASAGEAVPVTWWPAVLPMAVDGVHVIAVRGSGERDAARRAIRQALRDAVAQLCGLQPADIMIQFSPGVPPAVSFPGRPGARAPGISISHDGPLSLAAIHLNGAVGIDLMQVQAVDDWRAVACDYLGSEALARIEAAPSAEQASAFARAWAEHEARLKCHGRQLGEWTGEPLPALCRPVALPAPFVGAIATLTAQQ